MQWIRMNYKLDWNTFYVIEKNVLDEMKNFIGDLSFNVKIKILFGKSILKSTKLCEIASYENYTFPLISPQIIISNEYIW